MWPVTTRTRRALARLPGTWYTADMRNTTLIVLAASLTMGCYNLTGANHTKATKEAKAYAAQATKAGGDVKFVSCTDHDTDGDGYLACNFLVNGQPVTLDCAGKDLIQDNHGCKEFVAKARVSGSSQ